MKKIIFACVHNAGRSQMAAAFFQKLADSSKAYALSAGTEPAKGVHPEVIQVMKEVEIDLSKATPHLLTEELASGASHLITMGCGDKCPFIPGAIRLDWPLPDPRGQKQDEVRRIREVIRQRVEDFMRQNDFLKNPTTKV